MATNDGFGIPATREDELRAQAEQLVAAEESDEEILARLKVEIRAKREAALRGEAEKSSGAEGTGFAEAQGFPNKYVRLHVFKGNSRADQEYVKVGVNGYAFKIARGVDVIVPSVVMNALRDAVQEITVQSEGGLVTRPAIRFPFNVLGDATEAEYRKFVETSKQGAQPAVSHV